jgi:hypothetical protein
MGWGVSRAESTENANNIIIAIIIVVFLSAIVMETVYKT